MATPDTPAMLIRGLRQLQIATVILFALLAALGAWAWWDSHQTHKAICAFRADLQHRIEDGEKYLADHPNGVFGLTAAQIQSSLDGQRRTVAALTVAGCD